MRLRPHNAAEFLARAFDIPPQYQTGVSGSASDSSCKEGIKMK
jgi:hypothetical protein